MVGQLEIWVHFPEVLVNKANQQRAVVGSGIARLDFIRKIQIPGKNVQWLRTCFLIQFGQKIVTQTGDDATIGIKQSRRASDPPRALGKPKEQAAFPEG